MLKANNLLERIFFSSDARQISETLPLKRKHRQEWEDLSVGRAEHWRGEGRQSLWRTYHVEVHWRGEGRESLWLSVDFLYLF